MELDEEWSIFWSLHFTAMENHLILEKNCHTSNAFWLYQLRVRNAQLWYYSHLKSQNFKWNTLYIFANILDTFGFQEIPKNSRFNLSTFQDAHEYFEAYLSLLKNIPIFCSFSLKMFIKSCKVRIQKQVFAIKICFQTCEHFAQQKKVLWSFITDKMSNFSTRLRFENKLFTLFLSQKCQFSIWVPISNTF